MEGLREGAENAQNHAVARRTFLAFSTAIVAQSLRGVCAAEEGTEVRKGPTIDEVKDAMGRIEKLTFDDFRKGVEIAGVVIKVPDDGKAWGTIVAGGKTWMLRAKRGLAKAFVKDGCVITEMSWDGEKGEMMTGELLTVLKADGPLLPERKKVSRKTHPFEKTAEFMFRLCNDTEDIVLSDAGGRVTGVVLTLDPPEAKKEEQEEEE